MKNRVFWQKKGHFFGYFWGFVGNKKKILQYIYVAAHIMLKCQTQISRKKSKFVRGTRFFSAPIICKTRFFSTKFKTTLLFSGFFESNFLENWHLLLFFFFVFLIFNFISPNVCHWDMFLWREATEFAVTETIIFPFFFVNKQPIFLSQWLFSLRRENLSQRPYFCRKVFSPAAGWLIYELHLGILFSLKKLAERHYLVR